MLLRTCEAQTRVKFTQHHLFERMWVFLEVARYQQLALQHSAASCTCRCLDERNQSRREATSMVIRCDTQQPKLHDAAVACK